MEEIEVMRINGELIEVPPGAIYIDQGSRGYDNINLDNETWRRLIAKGQFKTFTKMLRENPERISRETFSVLADFLLSLPEKGKRGPKPNKAKQENIVSMHEAKKKKRTIGKTPEEDKRIKAGARQAKKRLKDKEAEALVERTNFQLQLDKLLDHDHPSTKGLTDNLP